MFAAPARRGRDDEDSGHGDDDERESQQGRGTAPTCSVDEANRRVIRKEVEKIIIPDLPDALGWREWKTKV